MRRKLGVSHMLLLMHPAQGARTAGNAMQMVLASVFVTAILSGCSIGSAVPSSEPTVCDPDAQTRNCFVPLSFDQLIEEWNATISGLDFPVGSSLDPPTAEGFGGGEQSFQPGYGALLAHERWFCEWQQEWLGVVDVGDGGAETAMRHMKQFLQTDSYERFYVGDSAVRNAIEQAEAGDSTELKRRFIASCK